MLPMFESSHSHHHRRGVLQSSWLRYGVPICLLVLLIYVYRNNTELQKQIRKNDAQLTQTKQQQDSLSAQLQVVYEHKSRLERSLKESQDEHVKCKTELQEQSKTASSALEEHEGKFHSLQQSYASLQQQLNEIKDERLAADNTKNSELTKTKDDLSNALSDLEKLRIENEEGSKLLDAQRLELTDTQNELKTCRTNGGKREVPTVEQKKPEEIEKKQTEKAAPTPTEARPVTTDQSALDDRNATATTRGRPDLGEILKAGAEAEMRDQVAKPKLELPDDKQVIEQPDVDADKDFADDQNEGVQQQRLLEPDGDDTQQGQGMRVIKQPVDQQAAAPPALQEEEQNEPEERGPPDDADYREEEDDKAAETL